MYVFFAGKAAAAAAPAVSATAETATDDAAPESSSNRPPRGGRGAASGGKHQVESATGSQRAKNVEKIPALGQCWGNNPYPTVILLFHLVSCNLLIVPVHGCFIIFVLQRANHRRGNAHTLIQGAMWKQ
jgi:hypothetical protein